MVTLGVILLLIGFVAGIPILWGLDILLVIVGLILWVAGSAGHMVDGRRHYF